MIASQEAWNLEQQINKLAYRYKYVNLQLRFFHWALL